MAQVRQTVCTAFHAMNSARALRAFSSQPVPMLALCAGFLALLAVIFFGACKPHAAAPPLPYVAFIANQQGNSVAAVDLRTLQMLSSIPVATSPTQVVFRPGAKELYVVSTSGTVSVITFPELRVVKTIAVGRSAASLVFSPDGSRAYLLNPAEGQVVFLDSGNRRETGRMGLGGKPSSIALSPDGKLLMIAVLPSDFSFIDTETRNVLSTIRVGQDPGPMAVRPDGKEVFVSGIARNTISAVEVPSRRLLANLAVAAPITALVPKPDGGELFALSSQGSLAVILDAYHDNVEQSITTGQNPVAGVFRRDMSVFYIATAGDGNVTALDVQTHSVISVVHAGTQPSALALTPDERFLAVTDAASASLAILRTDSLGLVTTIPVGSNPVHVVIPDWLWNGGR
jgi:DNA-binding beta-propeller fold protein YncE